MQAGPVGSVQKNWPALSKIHRDDRRPSLLLFLHPNCSCSKASVGELERLLVYTKDQADVRVIFARSQENETPVMQTAIWKQVQELSGVKEIIVDETDFESQLFGAKTSGQTFLYDENGKLVFAGGLTPSRGHMGDSVGREAILSWLQTKKSNLMISSVYGCLIRKPSSDESAGLRP